MEGFDIFDELKEDLGDIFARTEDEYSPENIELDPDKVVDLSLNLNENKKDGEDLNKKNNNNTKDTNTNNKKSSPESLEDKDREVNHNNERNNPTNKKTSLKSENRKNKNDLDNTDKDNNEKNRSKDNLKKDKDNNKNNNKSNNKNRNNKKDKSSHKKDNQHNEKNNNRNNNKNDNKSKNNSKSNNKNKSNNQNKSNGDNNDKTKKTNINNSKDDIKNKGKEDVSSNLNKQDAKDILNMVVDKEKDNEKNIQEESVDSVVDIDKNKPLYSQVKKDSTKKGNNYENKKSIKNDDTEKDNKKEKLKDDVEVVKKAKDVNIDHSKDTSEEKCEDCSDYITMHGKKYQEVSEDTFIDIDTGKSFNRKEILETEEEREKKRRRIERDKLRDELSFNKKKNKRVKLNSSRENNKEVEKDNSVKENIKETPEIKSSKDIRNLINAQDNDRAIKKTVPGKREDDIFVEEALKEREGRSAPPIKNSFLAAIFMVIEELFENLRFYKISSATMYKKVLEDDLSTADLLAHIITSLFLASGLVNILSEFKIFGRANGVINTVIARKFKFFFALVVFSPLLKLILIALLGSIFNVKRGSDREKYGDTLKYIIINSYSRFIFVFVFNIMSVFNPSIAIALIVPVILKGGLKDTFNVSGLFNKRDVSDMEMVVFISLYYIIMFGVLRYFYLF